MRKVLFIVNPASAGGRTRQRWEQAIPKFEAADFVYDVRFTEKRGDASRFAKEAAQAKDRDVVVSVGGDGTANETVNGLMSSRSDAPLPAFTIFPSGTGSDSVRTLGIPKDVDGFIRMVETHAFQPIDIGQANFITDQEEKGSRYFLNACDVGIGATVANAVNSMNEDSEKKSGKAKYFRSIMEQVFKFKAFDATVTTEDEEVAISKTVIVAVCNGMFFGGGVKVSPVSKMNDGLLELVATNGVSKPGLLGLVSQVYSGSHMGHPKVKFQRSEGFVIKLKKPQLLETDGEVCGVVTEVHFEVLPRVLRVLR
ncbi:MAG: diacylglycerol kinase family lipid kinase [Turicibacter sp.]|nr:diacylglycerol kinase family lipid kinase [Turicibacter sp.]